MKESVTFLAGKARASAEITDADAVEFARQYLGFEVDAKQREVLLAEAPRTIVNTTRMWGKSTVAAVKALHWVWRNPGRTVALVSASRRESAALMRLTGEMGRGLGVRSSEGRLGLRQGWIVGAAASDRPLPKADLTIVDDAARVADVDMAALRPVVEMAKGRLLLMSTPVEHSGFFFRIWTAKPEKSAGWVKISATAEECERLSPEFLEEERVYLEEIPFWRAYMCNYDDEAVRPKIYAGWVNEPGGEFMDGPWGYEEEYWKDREMPEGHTLWEAAQAKKKAEAKRDEEGG